MKKLFATDILTYSTVRIECDFGEDKIGTGTGFFMNLCKDGESSVPVIVTNRHVVNGARHGKFCLTLKTSEEDPDVGSFKWFEFEDFESQWIFHRDLDLAVMPIGSLITKAAENGEHFFFTPLDTELIPTNEELADMPAMQEVVMVGYPNGIWDHVNNQPVFRKGITATHPELDYNGKPEFLIDAACFIGSSGSPVFIVDIGKITTRSGGTNIGPGRIKLIGVLYAGMQHVATGEIETVEIATQKEVVVTEIPNNLGNVILSKAILDFEPHLQHIVDHNKKPSRNDECPCGSALKYKRCCGKIV